MEIHILPHQGNIYRYYLQTTKMGDESFNKEKKRYVENCFTFVDPWAPCPQSVASGPSPSSAPRSPVQMCQSAGRRQNQRL